MKRVPRRRPKVGGYLRGDETRSQIIDTALRVFGERGFDQATTRDIAAKAGVNPPALQYYFGSKDGLHRACAQLIIDSASRRLRPAIEQASNALLQGDRSTALGVLENLVDALTDSLTEPHTESWSRFIMRSKYDGAGPGVDMIRAQLSLPTIDAVAGLIAVITDTPAASQETRLRTLMVLGQIHWLHAGRDQALKVMHWSKFDAPKIALIKKMVRENFRSMLREFLPAPARSPDATRRADSVPPVREQLA